MCSRNAFNAVAVSVAALNAAADQNWGGNNGQWNGNNGNQWNGGNAPWNGGGGGNQWNGGGGGNQWNGGNGQPWNGGNGQPWNGGNNPWNNPWNNPCTCVAGCTERLSRCAIANAGTCSPQGGTACSSAFVDVLGNVKVCCST